MLFMKPSRAFFSCLFLLLLTLPLLADIPQIESTKTIAAIWKRDTGDNTRIFLGSGVLIHSNGKVLTARHVVHRKANGDDVIVGGEVLEISLGSKSPPYYPVYGSPDCSANTNIDICVIQLGPDIAQKENITNFFQVRCYPPPQDRWEILAVGFTGFQGAPTLQRSGSTSIGFAVPARQLFATDIQLVPGMSGGPIFDQFYRIIGVVYGADEASRNLGLFTPSFGAIGAIERTPVTCAREPDALAEIVPVQFFPAPRLLDFRTILGPNSSVDDRSKAEVVISVETLSYANVVEPGPKARVSSERLLLHIDDDVFEFREFQRVNIGTNGSGWLGRIGDPLAIALEQGAVAGHTTQFRLVNRNDLSWGSFKNFVKSGSKIKATVKSSVSWKLQTKTRQTEISVTCDPTLQEEHSASALLRNYEAERNYGQPTKVASRLQIYCVKGQL